MDLAWVPNGLPIEFEWVYPRFEIFLNGLHRKVEWSAHAFLMDFELFLKCFPIDF